MEISFPDHGHCGALTGLLRDSAGRLRSRGSLRSFQGGQRIYAMGEATDHLYLVLVGRVRTSVLSPEGREVVVGLHGAGELFGELCFCDVRQRQEQALALEPCTVARLDAGDLVGLATASPADAAGLLEVFCHRVATLQSQLVELAFANVRTRLGLLLLRLAERGAPQPDGSRVAAENLTHEEMALRISTTREQVSALLAEFRARGLVQYQRAEPMRIYPERLQAILERV